MIWLGTTTQEIDYLFYWMHRLDQEILKVESQQTMTDWARAWTLLDWKSHKMIDFSIIREGLRNLLGREWFSRIWVIQEAALAKEATVTCGHNNIRSRAFAVMPKLLGIRCDENVQSRLEVMPGMLRRTSWWAGPESQELIVLLQKFGRSKAKEPRDIIYALLGLSKDAFASRMLRPNYEISLQEVVQHAVAYLLFQSGHMKNPRHHDMPAWSMEEFLSSLESLPSRAHKWDSYHGKMIIPRIPPPPPRKWKTVTFTSRHETLGLPWELEGEWITNHSTWKEKL